jgi:predicted MFS family arabinose efflux permease
MGLVHTPWIGALMVVIAIILTGISAKLERK